MEELGGIGEMNQICPDKLCRGHTENRLDLIYCPYCGLRLLEKGIKEGIKYIENGIVIDCTYGKDNKCDEIKEAIRKRDRQWEDAIDKCTPDGSVKIIKENLTKE